MKKLIALIALAILSVAANANTIKVEGWMSTDDSIKAPFGMNKRDIDIYANGKLIASVKSITKDNQPVVEVGDADSVAICFAGTPTCGKAKLSKTSAVQRVGFSYFASVFSGISVISPEDIYILDSLIK